MSTDKLIETLNQAIQKAGGEAARVWPDMVALCATRALFAACAATVAAALIVTAGVIFARKMRGEFGAIEYALFAAIILLLSAIPATMALDNFARALHPEAALVRELMAR